MAYQISCHQLKSKQKQKVSLSTSKSNICAIGSLGLISMTVYVSLTLFSTMWVLCLYLQIFIITYFCGKLHFDFKNTTKCSFLYISDYSIFTSCSSNVAIIQVSVFVLPVFIFCSNSGDSIYLDPSTTLYMITNPKYKSKDDLFPMSS